MIRKAKESDLPVLDRLYENARIYMHTHGNPNQWNDGHPCAQDLFLDIKDEQLYVVEEAGEILASFVFYVGEDPTYGYIEGGNWLDDEPYGAIHKVASMGIRKGMGHTIIEWCKQQWPNLRMDTHADNYWMQKLMLREHFQPVGTIFLANGDPRLAYQYRQIDCLEAKKESE